MRAEATGRRRGAIDSLRWEDADLGEGTIRWLLTCDVFIRACEAMVEVFIVLFAG